VRVVSDETERVVGETVRVVIDETGSVVSETVRVVGETGSVVSDKKAIVEVMCTHTGCIPNRCCAEHPICERTQYVL
jgi:hypothetical protein